MLGLIETLYLTNRAFVTDEYDDCLDHIDQHELPLTTHRFESGTEIWDSWLVPPKWSVAHGYLEDADGNRFIEYGDHPLHLIAYSESFEGWVDRETLLDHTYTHPELSSAIPWHFRLNYRPWESDWGFCAAQETVDALTDEKYYVSIDTTTESGAMTVAEHTIEGERDETIVLAAHLDHTGMANDDLAGVAAGIECLKTLAEWDDRRYNYTLLVVPEMLGTAAFLDRYRERVADFEYCMFLEMPGNDNRLLYQETFTGDTRLDRIATTVLDHRDIEGERDESRAQIGNDELIFEGPGFEIPTLSLSRYPYPEYHTHLDDPSILEPDRLDSYVDVVLDICRVLERDFVPTRTFDGIPSLANPKYDLYLDPGQVALDSSDGADEALATFQDRLFRYLDGNHSVLDIADRFGLPFDIVHDHLRAFHRKGLVTVTDPMDATD